MKPALVIMAAGMGSRYGGLKQIDPMGPAGETLLEYSVFDAIRAGFGKVVFIIRKDFEEDFKGVVGSKFSGQVEVDYAFQSLTDVPENFNVPAEREKPWGTSHAVLCVKDKVAVPFAVQNADDFYGAEAYQVIARELKSMQKNDRDSCMVGFKVKNTLSPNGAVTRGICCVENGFLTSVVERSKIEKNKNGVIQYYDGDHPVDMRGDEICSMNFWGFTPLIFETLEEDFSNFLQEKGNELKSEWLIPTTVDELIKKEKTRVKVLSSSDQWFGVTYPEDKPQVMRSIKELVDQGKYPSPLF